MNYVIIVLLTAIAFELFMIYKELEKQRIKEEHKPEQLQYILTDEDKQEFLSADKDAAQGFYSALSKLNAFMTDSEEDNTDVGRQEI